MPLILFFFYQYTFVDDKYTVHSNFPVSFLDMLKNIIKFESFQVLE